MLSTKGCILREKGPFVGGVQPNNRVKLPIRLVAAQFAPSRPAAYAVR